MVLAAFVCGLVLQCGCDADDGTEALRRAALEETVREYNRLLVQGFAEMDMAVLEPVATQEQAEREYVYLAALGEGRMRLEATLISIEFGPVGSSGATSTVETTEVWDYRRVDIDTGELMAEEADVRYHLRYSLIPVVDRWVVASIETLEADPALPGAEGRSE